MQQGLPGEAKHFQALNLLLSVPVPQGKIISSVLWISSLPLQKFHYGNSEVADILVTDARS